MTKKSLALQIVARLLQLHAGYTFRVWQSCRWITFGSIAGGPCEGTGDRGPHRIDSYLYSMPRETKCQPVRRQDLCPQNDRT